MNTKCITNNKLNIACSKNNINISILTKRQNEVLTLLSEGKCNKEIAKFLNISENTVKVHLSIIYRILNVNSRVNAVIASQRLCKL